MAIRLTLLLKATVFTLTLFFSQAAIAQIAEHTGYLYALSPDSGKRPIVIHPVLPIAVSAAERETGSRENTRLLKYLKDLGIPDQQYKYQSNKKVYYHLANVFARLKLYPLAMKCFFKAVRSNRTDIDSLHLPDTGLNNLSDENFSFSSKDDAIVDSGSQVLNTKPKAIKSKRTSYQQIISNFNDGKTAIAYALLFHVKQPAPGKRKIFVGVNTGHTFITLIKYNSDSTYASASFGFYPDKEHLLSASPIFPTTPATFKDDSRHLWDEVLGKFISKRKFDRILGLTRNFEGMEYNLNRQNCTDFGLQAAGLAGIHIVDTIGKWPLGRGNNPAVTGQSILMGKVIDDGGFIEQIFMDDTVSERGKNR